MNAENENNSVSLDYLFSFKKIKSSRTTHFYLLLTQEVTGAVHIFCRELGAGVGEAKSTFAALY